MKKNAILWGLFVGLLFLTIELFITEKIRPVPVSVGNYKWIAYLFISLSQGAIGYYSYLTYYKRKQKKLS